MTIGLRNVQDQDVCACSSAIFYPIRSSQNLMLSLELMPRRNLFLGSVAYELNLRILFRIRKKGIAQFDTLAENYNREYGVHTVAKIHTGNGVHYRWSNDRVPFMDDLSATGGQPTCGS